MKYVVMKDRTDIFGAFAIWARGKTIPTEIFKLQQFMRKSPLGKHITKLEKQLANNQVDKDQDVSSSKFGFGLHGTI